MLVKYILGVYIIIVCVTILKYSRIQLSSSLVMEMSNDVAKLTNILHLINPMLKHVEMTPQNNFLTVLHWTMPLISTQMQ